MLQSFAANAFLVTLVLVFIAVLLLLEGGYLLWQSHRSQEAKRIGKRLRAFSRSSHVGPQAQLLKDRMLSDVPAFERWLSKLPHAAALQRYIQQSGLDWTVSRLLLTSLATAAIGFILLVSAAHQVILVGAAGALLLASLPLGYVSWKRQRRLEKMEEQLPEALDFMTRALRSGHAFSSALLMVGEEMQDPIAGEFKMVHDEINFGVAIQQALTNLSERVPLTDLRYFVVSVLIQRDTGGNLTEVLSNLSRLIRERLKLIGRVRVLSANGRFSAWTLVVLPFALGVLMNLMNPDFMSPLWTDPIGVTILQVTLGLMVIGVLIMRKIIKIRV